MLAGGSSWSQRWARAPGKVQLILAEVDPEAATPAERLRALENGRWELRAVIDAECRHGLQQPRDLMPLLRIYRTCREFRQCRKSGYYFDLCFYNQPAGGNIA